MDNAGVRIYVMTHKSFPHPDLEGFVPIQVGSALHEDLGYLRDDTGDNISDLNPFYSELTGQYWVWKNDQDSQIIGCCHYRRYFINDKNEFLTVAEIEKILSGTEILAACLEDPRSWRELYGAGHNIEDLYELGRVIKEREPESYECFKKLLDSHTICFGNMYVMPRHIYTEYMEWLFPILVETGDRIDISSYDTYERRVFGLLSENLIQVFAKTRGYRLTPGKVSIIADKSETAELKMAIGQLVKEGRISEATELFDKVCGYRKDVLFSQSDLNGDLYKLGEQLHALEIEKIAEKMASDPTDYELFYKLGRIYKSININQALLCFETALFYCDNPQDYRAIENEYMILREDGANAVRNISLMILSYNDLAIMKRLFQSIEECVPKQSCEIVIVDNCSSEEGTAQFLQEYKDKSDYQIKLILCDENKGFSKGCNIGAVACDKNNDILFLNNDTILTHNAVFWLRMGLYENKNVGAVGPLTTSSGKQKVSLGVFENISGKKLEPKWHKEYGLEDAFGIFDMAARKLSVPLRNPYFRRFRLTGFAVLLSRTALDQVAPDMKVFDELYSPAYFEDDDLGLRVASAGFKQYICKNSFIFHAGGDGEGFNGVLEKSRKKFIEKWGFDIWDYYDAWDDLENVVLSRVKQFGNTQRIIDFTSRIWMDAAVIKDSSPDSFVVCVSEIPVMASVARNLADEVIEGDLNHSHIPFADHSFDIVIAQKGIVSAERVYSCLKDDGIVLWEG